LSMRWLRRGRRRSGCTQPTRCRSRRCGKSSPRGWS